MVIVVDIFDVFLAIEILLGHGDICEFIAVLGRHFLVLGPRVQSSSAENQEDAQQASSRDDVVERPVSQQSLNPVCCNSCRSL